VLNAPQPVHVLAFKSLTGKAESVIIIFRWACWTLQEFKTKSSFDRPPSNCHGKLYLDWMKIQGQEYSRNFDMNKKKTSTP
jgi:hypothetical protein